MTAGEHRLLVRAEGTTEHAEVLRADAGEVTERTVELARRSQRYDYTGWYVHTGCPPR